MTDESQPPNRRATDRPSASTLNVEALAQNAKIGLPLALRIISGLGNTSATILLALVGYAYSSIHAEWAELKATVEAIKTEVSRMPTPEEYQRLRDKVDQVNERLIRIESRFDE